jgi:hypothetical protein
MRYNDCKFIYINIGMLTAWFIQYNRVFAVASYNEKMVQVSLFYVYLLLSFSSLVDVCISCTLIFLLKKMATIHALYFVIKIR